MVSRHNFSYRLFLGLGALLSLCHCIEVSRPEVTFLPAPEEENCFAIQVSHAEGLRNVEVQRRSLGAEWQLALTTEATAQEQRMERSREVQVVQTRAAHGMHIQQGYFRLSLQSDGRTPLRAEDKALTGFIPHDATSQDMQAALEELGAVDAVQVVRTGPDEEGGYRWTVTFLSVEQKDTFAGEDVPLLTVFMQNLILPLPPGEEDPVVVFGEIDAGSQIAQQQCLQSPCTLQICHLPGYNAFQFRARVVTQARNDWSDFSLPTPIGMTRRDATTSAIAAPTLSSATEHSLSVRVKLLGSSTQALVQVRDVRYPWHWQDVETSKVTGNGSGNGNHYVHAVARDLEPGESYEFRAKVAENPSHWSATSLPMKTRAPFLEVIPTPEMAQIDPAAIGPWSVTLRWKPVVGATGYSIQLQEVYPQDVHTYDAPEGYRVWKEVPSAVAEEVNYVVAGPISNVHRVSTRVDSHMTIAAGGFILSTVHAGELVLSSFLPFNAEEADMQTALVSLGYSPTAVVRSGPSSRYEFTWTIISSSNSPQSLLSLYYENITKTSTYSGPGDAVKIDTLQHSHPGQVDTERAAAPNVTINHLRPSTSYRFRLLARNDFDGRVSEGWSSPSSIVQTLPSTLDPDSYSGSPAVNVEEEKLAANLSELLELELEASSNYSDVWVEIRWVRPTSIGSALPGVGAIVERSLGHASKDFATLDFVEDLSAPLIDADVEELTLYSYRARFVWEGGAAGDPSGSTSITTPKVLERKWEQHWPQRPSLFAQRADEIREENKTQQGESATANINLVKHRKGLEIGVDDRSTRWYPSARYGHSVNTVGAYVYMFGGFTEGEDCSFQQDPTPSYTCRTMQSTTDELWRLRVESDTWEELPTSTTSPPARYLHAAAVRGAEMYIFGGLLHGPETENSATASGLAASEEITLSDEGLIEGMMFGETDPAAPEAAPEALDDLWRLSTPAVSVLRATANLSTNAMSATFEMHDGDSPLCITALSLVVTLRHSCPSQLTLYLHPPMQSDLRATPESDVIFVSQNRSCSSSGDHTHRFTLTDKGKEGSSSAGRALARFIQGRIAGLWTLKMVDSAPDEHEGYLLSAVMEASVIECRQPYSWTKLSANHGPPARYAHSALTTHDALWIFGGTSPTQGMLDDLWRFDLALNEWLLVTPHAGLRQTLGDATVLAPQGLFRLDGSRGIFHLLQPSMNGQQAELLEEFPALRDTQRMFAGLSVVGDRAVIVGGHNGIAAESDHWTLPLKDVAEREAFCSWQSAQNPSTQPKALCTIQSINSTSGPGSTCTISHVYSLAWCEQLARLN